MKKVNWGKYGFEFLSIFIAVISAFALNNWNENRRDHRAEEKILAEIANGLKKDMDDVRLNVQGHKDGIKACIFWRKVLLNQEFVPDTLPQHYLNLTRDFISIQNISGYETLKSKGLELIKNDSLRFKIISLYEYDYKSLKKLEEDYAEIQFQREYFPDLNRMIAPYFQFDNQGNITGIQTPLDLSSKERNILLSYLWKIQFNRQFMLISYGGIEKKINDLEKEIELELD